MIKYCSLYSGSSGNSHFICKDNTRILVDAGLSGKKIEEALKKIDEDPSLVDGIIVSHEHGDHSKGIGVMARRYNIPVYANKSTMDSIRPLLYNVHEENIRMFTTNEPFEIKDFTVLPFPIPHDAGEPVGFSIIGEYKKVTIATDLGHMSDKLQNYLENSKIILLESNHDVEMLRVGRYPWYLKKRILSDTGHLSNDIAGEVIAKLARNGCEKFILGHLSKENNFPELAYETVASVLKDNDIIPDKDIELSVAQRDRVGIPVYV